MARITIVSPCYNEEDNVEACYQAVLALFAPDGPLAHHEGQQQEPDDSQHCRDRVPVFVKTELKRRRKCLAVEPVNKPQLLRLT